MFVLTPLSLSLSGKHPRSPDGSQSEEEPHPKKKKKRTSDESVRSHESDIDDHSAAVFIRIGGGGFCNGTLITYRTKLFVWTTAHALVDTTKPALSLHDGIELLLARDVKQRPLRFQRLAWVQA